MFRKISTRLVGTFVTFFLLIGASALASHIFSRDLPADNLVLHLSVRAQALLAQTSRDTLIFARLQESEHRLQQRDRVLSDVRAFETTLHALVKGGAAPLDEAGTSLKEVEAVTLASAAEQLAKSAELWKLHAEFVHGVIDSDGSDTTALVNVLSREGELQASLAAASSALREETERKHAVLAGIQMVALGGGLAFLLFVLWATSKHIQRPLRGLVRAAESISTGQLDAPVDVQGPQEIEELAESFERMRVSVQAVLHASGPVDELDELDDL